MMDVIEMATEVAGQLEQAWNAADGAGYGRSFAPEADFVTIRGERFRGDEIAAGHQQIFDTIYAGSVIRFEVMSARPVDDAVVAHLRSTLDSPAGPLAGIHRAMATIVLVAGDDGHRIAALHNTLIAA